MRLVCVYCLFEIHCLKKEQQTKLKKKHAIAFGECKMAVCNLGQHHTISVLRWRVLHITKICDLRDSSSSSVVFQGSLQRLLAAFLQLKGGWLVLESLNQLKTLKMDVQGFRVEILAIRVPCKARVSTGVSDNTNQGSVQFRSECVTALVPVSSLGKTLTR